MDIMNRLPVKSLLQFRVVSKQWKFSIDSFDFIRNYGCREINTCCFNLSFRHNSQVYIHSFDENLAFRNFDSNLDFFSLRPVASSEGIWCFSFSENSFLVLWNPSMKKSVAISVPNYRQQPDSPKMIFGFGICPVTLEPTILKINYPLYTDGPCLLFNIPHPAGHFLKLLGFSNDNQPIVEAEIVQQWYRSLQVFHPIIDGFVNIGVEANRVVRLSSNTRAEPYPSTSNPVRIIPGPAGIVQQAKLLKEKDDDFNSEAWVSATKYVIAFGGTVTGCLGDIDNFLIKGKLDHIVAIVKSCSSNMLSDLNVTLKDILGTIPGTIHHKVIGDGGYEKNITVGADMILKNVSVFTPKPSEHYLNITMRNVVEVFRKDTVLGSCTG
ncbi:transposase, MuDR, MULE transposase domain protein [Tanacetum coccineum]